MISKASKLRVGRFQSELVRRSTYGTRARCSLSGLSVLQVAACRAAVKANNVQSLTRIIRVGAS